MGRWERDTERDTERDKERDTEMDTERHTERKGLSESQENVVEGGRGIGVALGEMGIYKEADIKVERDTRSLASS